MGFELVAESPLTVSALDCPGLIEVGLNAHVAPDSQERVMALVKLLGAEVVTVKVVDAVPIRTVLEVLAAESEKTGAPLPVSETACGLPEALSVIVSDPVRLPVAVGLNVTVKIQLAAGASCTGGVPHVLVWAKSPESPVRAIIVTFNAADPLFESVTVWAGLVAPTVSFGNVRLVGERVTAGACATPVPARAIWWGLPAASSVRVS